MSLNEKLPQGVAARGEYPGEREVLWRISQKLEAIERRLKATLEGREDQAGNTYFDGKIISENVVSVGGFQATVGKCMPGEYPLRAHAESRERIIIQKGAVLYRLKGSAEWKEYGPDLEGPNASFVIPENTEFEWKVEGDQPVYYKCIYLDKELVEQKEIDKVRGLPPRVPAEGILLKKTFMDDEGIEQKRTFHITEEMIQKALKLSVGATCYYDPNSSTFYFLNKQLKLTLIPEDDIQKMQIWIDPQMREADTASDMFSGDGEDDGSEYGDN